jgi:hypothetical protein
MAMEHHRDAFIQHGAFPLNNRVNGVSWYWASYQIAYTDDAATIDGKTAAGLDDFTAMGSGIAFAANGAAHTILLFRE